MLFPFISGVDHNSNPARKSAGFIQRIAYAKLSPDNREAFRVWSRAEAIRFIESIDDWITTREVLVNESADDPISGVGVFYYEGPEAADIARPEPEVEQ
jgi:hypothetical protein